MGKEAGIAHADQLCTCLEHGSNMRSLTQGRLGLDSQHRASWCWWHNLSNVFSAVKFASRGQAEMLTHWFCLSGDNDLTSMQKFTRLPPCMRTVSNHSECVSAVKYFSI
jgi:hypothetical protein